jgi:cytochrome b6-f complex iron-sulfur subunit
MNRRRFLRVLTSILGVSALGAFAYPLLRFLSPLEAGLKAKSILIPKGEIPLGAVKDLIVRGLPAMVINRRDKGYIVLSKVCTHLGCLVKYDKERQLLICPCHAGTFDLEGNVISGPPPRPLEKFPLRVEGDNLVVG